MYVGHFARVMPEKPAAIHAGTGEVLTYRELDERSNRFAHYLYAIGLRRGDHIALFMENRLGFFEICWAAFRSGLYITTVNRYLTMDEAAYVIADCGARVLVASAERADVAQGLPAKLPQCEAFLMTGGAIPGWRSYEDAIAPYPADALAEEWIGDAMLYSSGTTGRPKGIRRELPLLKVEEGYRFRDALKLYGFTSDSVYLSPAPLYHAAPLAYSLGTQFTGGTVVMMDKFDPVASLAAIERHRVTHSQWVPTMFVRLLKLPEADRYRHDLSSHRVAIHAAAPCPVDVKRGIIEWWGPILHEYYAGTEANGSTRIDSHDWLAHPGSVGRAGTGILHICDDAGRELPPGEAGLIYFQRDEVVFAYHNDPAKTRAAQHPEHPTWTTLGDIGYVDRDGYLYLTDRKAFMIISGGVNIYPQQIEDALILHPKVGDVAVFGIPNEDMGEEVKAVVEPAPGVAPTAELAEELLAYARGRLAVYMVPRTLDFTAELPRLPTGKLYKRGLRDAYWKDRPAK
jgi:long-chain acyl-CoA synthetase